MVKKNVKERVAIVRAMELLARCTNDEDVFERIWLTCGVADGDIEATTTDEDIEMYGYTDDDTFAELMDTFTHLMAVARKNGGLYSDGVVSAEE